MGIQYLFIVTCDDCKRKETHEGSLASHEAARVGWRLVADGRIFCRECFKVFEQSRREINEKVEQKLF